MEESSFIVLALYGLIGVSGAISVIVFAWGFAVYISRIGTNRRDAGLHIMEWSIGFIIATIVLIGILNFVRGSLGV